MGSPSSSLRVARAATLALAPLVWTACGNNELEGKYYYRRQEVARTLSSSTDSIEYEFKAGNKVYVTEWGFQTFPKNELDYEINGKEIKLKSPFDTRIGSITDNGCLDFGDKQLLCKDEKK